MAIADPGPLGLASFALTTFVLSCYTAGIMGVGQTDPVNVITGLALFYGGLAQVLAGMWELAKGNTFAATAFTSYGAFWLSYATLLIPAFGVGAAYGALPTGEVFLRAIAIYLLGWTIFTFLMLVASLRTTLGLALLFLMLTLTFTLLTAAEFRSGPALGQLGSAAATHQAAGACGILTAAIAWYNALAGLLDSQDSPLFTLPVGRILPNGRFFLLGRPSGGSSSTNNGANDKGGGRR